MSRFIVIASERVAYAFQRDETLSQYYVRCEPGRIFFNHKLAVVRDADGLLWVRFPELDDHQRVRARVALNVLFIKLGVRDRYAFSMSQNRDRVTFSHRADRRHKWTHTLLGFGHWAPVATSPLAAILARQVMAGGEQPVIPEPPISNTTTVVKDTSP